MDHANGLDVFGVWGDRPMPTSELDMIQNTTITPGIQSLQGSHSDVQAWTDGARDACTEFRVLLQEYIAKQEKQFTADQTPRACGASAYVDALKSLL